LTISYIRYEPWLREIKAAFLETLQEVLLGVRHKTSGEFTVLVQGKKSRMFYSRQIVFDAASQSRHLALCAEAHAILKKAKLNGQDHADGGAFAGLRLDLEFPAVDLEHTANGSQTQAGAFEFRGAQD